MTQPASAPAPEDLETTVDETIAACDGSARAAVRVLLVTVFQLQAEINERDAEIVRLAVDISRGYSRGRRERFLTRTKVSHGLPKG